MRAVAAKTPRLRPVNLWWPALLNEDLPFDYLGPRPEVCALVPEKCRTALDLGCAAGSLGILLEDRGIRVTGVEIDARLADRASMVLTRVVTGDLVDVLRTGNGLDHNRYDVVIAADCLEHLVDPSNALRQAVCRLSPRGWVVVSLPNVRHWNTLWNLGVRGIWPQRHAGIHDRSHLRWFTRRSVIDLLEGAGLEVEHITSVRRVRESHTSWLDIPARVVPGTLGELLTFQWLARGRRRD
jgi:2-polyprenyl-3-methyl-5-hydroxy-6-metoxy-1,4-benzoquinol methylase